MGAPLRTDRASRGFVRTGLLTIACLFALTAAGCAMRPPVSQPSAAVSRASRFDTADRLTLAGCLDCLLEADRLLASVKPAGPEVIERQVRVALLIALRERELGLSDSGRLERARASLAQATVPPDRSSRLVAIADLLPTRLDGMAFDDETLRRRQTARADREAHVAFLQPDVERDLLSAYLWLTFRCTYDGPDHDKLQAWLAAITAWREAPLFTYRAATCGVLDLVALEQLETAEPRFVELNYFMALAASPMAEIDRTIPRLGAAIAWRPTWSTAVLARALAFFDRDAFEDALADFDRLLTLRPESPDALLGRIRALTHLARYDEAIDAADRLLAPGQWYIGDARFWRALNELQLGRLDQAWTDVELAAPLLVNAEVSKLAGIIAARRGDLETARDRFQASWRRNAKDCETGFHLSNVLSQQRLWVRAVDGYRETITCLEDEALRLSDEIETLRVSPAAAEYRAREIARREELTAAGRQMLAGAWYNTAVAYFNLARYDEARLAAERVRDDPFFGTQAQTLLARLAR